MTGEKGKKVKKKKGGGKANETPRASESDPSGSEEDSGTADQIAAMQQQPGTADQTAAMQQQMDEQVERRVAVKMIEERARLAQAQAQAQGVTGTAQNMTTPRRGGPLGPGTPASTPGKRIHSLV